MPAMEAGESEESADRLDAAHFDHWYANMAASPLRDAIVGRALGLPSWLRSSSLLPWSGIAEVVQALHLPRSGLLADIGCGRGGYGIEVARRAGARLVGVDFSPGAVEVARLTGASLMPDGGSEFRVGTLTATGLPAAAADGLMCVDAVQFASPPITALREFRRLLRPGARLAITCWEPVGPPDERVPARLRAVDLGRDLRAAGFTDVRVQERPAWREAERRMWQEAVALSAGADQALTSLQAEGRRMLDTFRSLRRVLATATGS
jgi:SAM-dependent methyltransferase